MLVRSWSSSIIGTTFILQMEMWNRWLNSFPKVALFIAKLGRNVTYLKQIAFHICNSCSFLTVCISHFKHFQWYQELDIIIKKLFKYPKTHVDLDLQKPFGFNDKDGVTVLHRKFARFAFFSLPFCVALNFGAKSHHFMSAVPRIVMNHGICKPQQYGSAWSTFSLASLNIIVLIKKFFA